MSQTKHKKNHKTKNTIIYEIIKLLYKDDDHNKYTRTNYYAFNEQGKSHDVIIRLEWLLIFNFLKVA